MFKTAASQRSRIRWISRSYYSTTCMWRHLWPPYIVEPIWFKWRRCDHIQNTVMTNHLVSTTMHHTMVVNSELHLCTGNSKYPGVSLWWPFEIYEPHFNKALVVQKNQTSPVKVHCAAPHPSFWHFKLLLNTAMLYWLAFQPTWLNRFRWFTLEKK